MVYDDSGKLIYDISSKRIKGFQINKNPKIEQKFLKDKKLVGDVPEEIKNIFGW